MLKRILLTPAALLLGSGIAAAAPLVNTTQGPVAGIDGANYHLFRNIPYAQPPVGALRWRAPQFPSAWPGTLDGAQEPRQCMRGPSLSTPHPVGTEDCLVLHVTRPASAAPGANLPVMVWIHGGGFALGNAGYDASALAAENNVVVVNVNYRLGAFGFLALEELRNEAADHSVGNYGLLDQIAALQWVRDNINAFGGNKNNVTIFGESAGAISVLEHLTSPYSRGLFHKAIAQSPATLAIGFVPSASEAIDTGEKFAEDLGCTNAATRVSCLRSKPAHDIALPGGLDILAALDNAKLTFAPTVDGVVLQVNPLDAITWGWIARVPVMIGSNRHEARPLVQLMEIERGHPTTQDDVNDTLQAVLNGPLWVGGAASVALLYPTWLHGDDPGRALAAAFGDFSFSCPTLVTRRRLDPQVPVYAYEFEDPNTPSAFIPSIRSGLRGSGHADELPYLFNGKSPTSGQPLPLSSDQQALAVKMRKYWGNFARTGNPNGAGLPNWPKFQQVTFLMLNREATQRLRPSNVGGIQTAYLTSLNLLDYDYADTHQCNAINLAMPFVRVFAPLLF